MQQLNIELRFCKEKFWKRLTNMVKPLTSAETMSNIPKAHEAADEVASAEDIDTEWSAKLLIVVDEKS